MTPTKARIFLGRNGWNLLPLLAILLIASTASARPAVDDLRCDARIDPPAVEELMPRFSWVVRPAHDNLSQSAYQVLVASSRQILGDNQGDLWDSGKIVSGDSFNVNYFGSPLPAETTLFWKARIWDEWGHPTHWSKPATFRTGLFSQKDWGAQWIGRARAQIARGEAPAVLLRKEFTVNKRVAGAVLSVCGLGYCIAEINGHRASDAELDPGFTAYDKRDLYVTDDVTRDVRRGTNSILLTLGGGWFNLATPDLFGFQKAPWSESPRALVHLKINFADGTSEVIVSDDSWQAGTGPIRFQCVRGGETDDFTRGNRWSPAAIVSAPKGILQPEAQPPIRRAQEIPAVQLTEPRPGVYQFRLAENTSGWPRLRVRGERGQKITLRCAEDFEPDGKISRHLNSHTYGRYQTEEFILADDREHELEPHFTYHGFQYVRVEGLKQRPELKDLTGVAVHTVLEPAGSFECSNPLFNRLHEMFVRTYLNNLHGIPTDCPQREKAGWMLDGYVASTIGMWNFQAQAFYEKWARDMADAQAANGSEPSIVPTPNWWGLLDPWWGGACVMAPWELYQRYDDTHLLVEQMPVMKKYVDYLQTRATNDLVNFSLGDWLEAGSGGPANRTPVELTSSMAYFYCAQIVGHTARIMRDDVTGEQYLGLAQRIRDSLNGKYFDNVHHRYAPDSQSASAMALVLGIVPEGERQAVLEELVRNITEDRHNHVSTGIVGTRFLFEALHAGGRDDIASAILTQPTFPGWVWMLDHGATTAWESWEGGNSRDHPALASVDEWFYEAIGGITPQPGSVAFDRITIAPQMAGGTTWASVSHDTLRGRIESRWSVKHNHFKIKVAIPAGTQADVIVPSKTGPRHYQCAAGNYTFKSEL